MGEGEKWSGKRRGEGGIGDSEISWLGQRKSTWLNSGIQFPI